MTCCPASSTVKSAIDTKVDAKGHGGPESGLAQWVHQIDDQHQSIDLLVPTIHCGGCIKRIESGYSKLEGITKARVNLSTKRLSLEWQPDKISAGQVIDVVSNLGFDARPFDKSQSGEKDSDKIGKELLRALAVAGFAAANVMLLSVSVWAGAQGMTRELFQWLSALIALPAVIYAGRPFFRSAINALSHVRLNMDVPISLAVILASAMSLYETFNHGAETYFDAAITLLFFLLAGRYLDHMMREKARSAVSQLLSLNSTGATVIVEDGEHRFVSVSDLVPGMIIHVAAGERVPVDGQVVSGVSDVDRSLVTGESLPEKLQAGMKLEAGVMNLTGALELRVTAVGNNTFLGEVIKLMETAEQGKARYMRIADRAAQIYAPVVHVLAALTFVGWLWWTGGDWHASTFAAIAVLIITCPCALGLAVPAVQIVASGILFRRGVLVKDGAALERMSNIDTVVFDKTGTLTSGELMMESTATIDDESAALAMALSASSLHPLSKALHKTLKSRGSRPAKIDKLTETPGFGVEADWQGKTVKLGEISWCGGQALQHQADTNSIVALSVDNTVSAIFPFKDSLRTGAKQTVSQLISQGINVVILSGDREPAVADIADKLAVKGFQWGMTPHGKVKFIENQIAAGKKVLMVGDGMNDAPSLAAATASMAPSTASDIGRTAADMVFTRPDLYAVIYALDIAQHSTNHVLQNFALAIAYNLVAVPLAITGFASPLFAAIAMSSSSIIVTSNALRLHWMVKPPKTPEETSGQMELSKQCEVN